jgi:hypothetical protein
MRTLCPHHPTPVDDIDTRYEGTGSWMVARILISVTAGFITTEA